MNRLGQSLSTFWWIDRAPRKEPAPGAEAFSGAESIHRIVLDKEPAPGAEAFSGAESIHENVDPRSGIDDRTSPENLEVECRTKTCSKVVI